MIFLYVSYYFIISFSLCYSVAVLFILSVARVVSHYTFMTFFRPISWLLRAASSVFPLVFKLDESYRLSKVFIYTLEFHTSSYIHIIYFALFRQPISLLIYYFISIILHIPENILFHIFPWSFSNFRFTFTLIFDGKKNYICSNIAIPIFPLSFSSLICLWI